MVLFRKHVTYGNEQLHADALRRGLRVLGHDYLASICHWCNGHTIKNLVQCSVCCDGNWTGHGLLQGGRPASFSVVNQVLEAATRSREIPLFDVVEKANVDC